MSKQHDSGLTLVEAVETLSNIADLEYDHSIGITQKHDVILQDQKITYRTVHWLHKQDAESTVSLVRETFRVILNYLRHFYEKDYTYVTDQTTLDRIKTIMVLVGEAAKKLDKYTNIFQNTHMKSITNCKEYKELQDFYMRKISRTIDEGVLGKWILALSKKALTEKKEEKIPREKAVSETTRVFVDLESVKKDTEYELFSIRKEDGSRFFSPRLIRNIKLICDFGHYFGKKHEKEIDPLEDLRITEDRSYLSMAQYLLKKIHPVLDEYYHEAIKDKEDPLGSLVSNGVMALMLASHSIHLYNGTAKKNCYDYFADFMHYLRESLHSREFHKLLAYPPKSSEKSPYTILKTVENLCLHLFQGLKDSHVVQHYVKNLISAAHEAQSSEHLHAYAEKPSLTHRLILDHTALQRYLRTHPDGPLNKVLNNLEGNIYQNFNPIDQMNIPQKLYQLALNDDKILVIRLPCPVHQEFIHKAEVIDTFKEFLRAYADKNVNGKHLLINLQDRSSWKDIARCKALEELQYVEDFENQYACITLAIDTEFYHQLAPYHDINSVENFKKALNEQVFDEACGFYFPETIKEKLVDFVPKTLDAIHRTFFSSKNVLSRERRMDFIEIFYQFLVLKVIELVGPTSLSLSSKDSLDLGQLAAVELLALFNFMSEDQWSEPEIEAVNGMLYGPALFHRERIILPECFNRTLSALKVIEGTKGVLGQEEFTGIILKNFKDLYETDVLKCSPIMFLT